MAVRWKSWQSLVPPRVPSLRNIEEADLPKIIRWIEQGRSEGVFRIGASLTATSLCEYHQSIRRSGSDYSCCVIEVDGTPAGYVDFQWTNGSAEILGLFLEEPYRGNKVGQFLLRRICIDLQERGCREALVEVYEENHASQRACQSAGFRYTPEKDRIEDGRQVRVLQRRLRPLRRMSLHDPVYRALKGVNLYRDHLALAEMLVPAMSQVPGVDLILGMGSLARSFGDQWSDLDLAILGRGLSLEHFWRGECWLANTDVDLFVVDTAIAPPERWDSSRRQAFEESVVLFSRKRGLTTDLRRSIRQTQQERMDQIRDAVFRLDWLGFASRTWYGKTVYGYRWEIPPFTWLQRGSLRCAHATVDQAFDLTLQLLYLLNGKHVPDPKWRRFRVSGLPWLPGRFAECCDTIEDSRRDEPGFHLRVTAVLDVLDEAIAQLEARGEITGDWYAAYLDYCPDYDPGR